MLASYRVHEISSRDALTPGLSVLRTKVFRSLIACKTFYHQTCAKTSPILLFGHAALPPRIPKQFLRWDMWRGSTMLSNRFVTRTLDVAKIILHNRKTSYLNCIGHKGSIRTS